MKIIIHDAKVISKYTGIGYGHSYEKMKTKEWITDSWVKWLREKHNVKVSKKTIMKNITIEKASPKTFPKYNNEIKFKLRSYNLVNPIIEEAVWNCVDGWRYRLKNLGHRFQAIAESEIYQPSR